MTAFEQLCAELNVPIELDDHGLYKGMTRALAHICCDVIINSTAETKIEETVKQRFYDVFPYMQK